MDFRFMSPKSQEFVPKSELVSKGHHARVGASGPTRPGHGENDRTLRKSSQPSPVARKNSKGPASKEQQNRAISTDSSVEGTPTVGNLKNDGPTTRPANGRISLHCEGHHVLVGPEACCGVRQSTRGLLQGELHDVLAQAS